MSVGFDEIHHLREGEDVVVGETEGLDLGQLRLFRESGQSRAEAIQGVVEHVHPVPLTIVRLHPASLLDPEDLSGAPGPDSGLAVPLLPSCRRIVVLHRCRKSFHVG